MRIYYLDGLRGLLALSVLLSHVIGGITGWTSDRLFNGAFLAVDLFFVLSGFVLARVLISEKYGLKSFFWMRFWRLWPLHVATILLSLIVFEINRSIGQYAPPDGSFSDLALVWKNAAFLMTLGIIDVPVINSPSWSIGIEFWLSALFLPLLVRGRVIVLLILAGAGYLFIAYYAHGLMAVQTIHPFVSIGLAKGLAGMAFGAAIYKSEININALLSRLDEQWLAALMMLALAFIASGIIWQGNSLLNFAVILAIVPILAQDSFSRLRTVNDFLSSEPLVWLGTISFSLYLVHTPMLVLLRVPGTAQSLGDVNAAIFLTVVCVIAAAVLHYFFEKPVARAVKNFNSEAASGASIWAATIAAIRPRRKAKDGSLAATPHKA